MVGEGLLHAWLYLMVLVPSRVHRAQPCQEERTGIQGGRATSEYSSRGIPFFRFFTGICPAGRAVARKTGRARGEF